MKIPKIVNIGGQEVKVQFKKNLKDEKGRDLLGLCDSENNRIVLAAGMPKSKRLSIFVHEYMHFVSSVHGWGLSEQRVIALEIAISNLILQLK